MTVTLVECPLCGGSATLVAEKREVSAGRRRVTITDEYMRCSECSESFYTPAQSERLELAAAEQLEKEDDLLSPAHIARIREGLGLSQREFDELLGVGAKSCARW